MSYEITPRIYTTLLTCACALHPNWSCDRPHFVPRYRGLEPMTERDVVEWLRICHPAVYAAVVHAIVDGCGPRARYRPPAHRPGRNGAATIEGGIYGNT